MDAVHSLHARVRALPPYRLDALIGVLVAVEGGAEVLLLAGLEGGAQALALLVMALVGLAAGLRRRLPVTALALCQTAMFLFVQVDADLVDNIIGPYFVSMLIAFTAGYVLEGRRLWVAAAIGVAIGGLSTATDSYPNDVESFVMTAALGVLGPMLLGQILRHRTHLNEALAAKAARLERERREEADAAALEERTRIAGELHDVVAHALSAMTVQAGAARRLVERDPDKARAAFASAEHTGREALTELRRLLGVLRREDEELALAPQPSLLHVTELIRRATAAGLPATLRTEGEVRALPGGVDLTAYRLVQEALTAARDRGSAGRAEVAIRYGDGDVVVEVSDDGAGDGRRLLGMRERVAVYGGDLSTRRLPAGGWSVAARLPVEAGR
jgi:signal transduction histidine kinase